MKTQDNANLSGGVNACDFRILTFSHDIAKKAIFGAGAKPSNSDIHPVILSDAFRQAVQPEIAQLIHHSKFGDRLDCAAMTVKNIAPVFSPQRLHLMTTMVVPKHETSRATVPLMAEIASNGVLNRSVENVLIAALQSHLGLQP